MIMQAILFSILTTISVYAADVYESTNNRALSTATVKSAEPPRDPSLIGSRITTIGAEKAMPPFLNKSFEVPVRPMVGTPHNRVSD